MRIRLALLFLCLVAAPSLAQEQGPTSPRELMERFEQCFADGDVNAGGRLFVLTDVEPAEDRAKRGRNAARQLMEFFASTHWPKTDKMVRDTHLKSWTWYYSYADRPTNIVADLQEDGSWLFNAETRRLISELVIEKTIKGLGGSETWVRDLFPGWMQRKAMLLRIWQWIALGVLLLLGVFLSLFAQILVMSIARPIAARRGVKLEGGRKAVRPFGLIATGVVWYVGLRYLLLGDTAFVVLVNAARFVLMVGVVWSVSRVVDWVAEIFQSIAHSTEGKLDDMLVPMVRKAVKFVIGLLGVVWIAKNMGQDIGAVLAGLGIGGLALALASRDTIENFFGVLTIIGDRPFEAGDWITLKDIEGTVESIGFRSTRVRTFYNSIITFPNSMLITNAVDNFGRRKYRRLRFHLGVTYDTPPDKLEAFIDGIRELIRLHPYTRKNYYHVYFHEFGDNALKILVYMFFNSPEWSTELRERQRLLMDILRLAAALKVEFAFPTQTLHMLQGTAPDHGEPIETLTEAWQTGQREAKKIVDEYTGETTPPPVEMGRRPDQAYGGDGTDGAGADGGGESGGDGE